MISGLNTGEHFKQSHELQPEPYVDFFEIRVNPTADSARLLLTNNPDTVWQGETWTNFPIELTGVASRTTGEANRPSLRLGNPNGVFSYLISTGQLYGGTVRRYRVLKHHLEAGVLSYVTSFWDISRVSSLNNHFAVLELRTPGDRQDYKLPARQFFPPEFPYVKIG